MVYNKRNVMKKNSLLKKSLMLILLVACSAISAVAQISEGEPYSRTIRTGNRPGSGDWGIFVGPSFSEIGQMVDGDISLSGFPLVNMKYYTNDNLELRCGIQMSRSTNKTAGDLIIEDYDYNTDNYVISEKPVSMKYQDMFYRLTPGIAYHFSSKNILDVYVGASLPFGISGDKYINIFDGKNYDTQKRTSLEIGLGAFIGLQCFVADLPVAVGFEYGFSGYKFLGQKYQHINVDEDGVEQVYYTTSSYYDDERYSTLKKSRGYFGSDVRFTISYFFK